MHWKISCTGSLACSALVFKITTCVCVAVHEKREDATRVSGSCVCGTLYGYLHAPVSDLDACLRPTMAGERRFFLHCNSVAPGQTPDWLYPTDHREDWGNEYAKRNNGRHVGPRKGAPACAFLFVRIFSAYGAFEMSRRGGWEIAASGSDGEALSPITAILDHHETRVLI